MESYGKSIDNGEYINILKILRDNGGPFNWIRKTKSFAKHTKKIYHTNIEKSKIFKNILESDNIVIVMKEISNDMDIDMEMIKNEAREILENMGQNFNIYVVYVVGYCFMTIFNYILNGVYINNKEIEKIKELITDHPIVFMPTHKSYLDFLLLSIVCYDQNLTLPAIAAGMDFQNSTFIGETLRLCGAFYLKRSFGTDKLYWSIFSEYIRTLITTPDRPLEYFVEGTRSRTQKSLFPKYGLLQMVVEPFLKNEVYDIQIIPVTINYDRVIEELLYGYELIGFPKPKESTSELVKSRTILSEKYGNVYMTFGEPISTRNFFGDKINRMGISRNPKIFIKFDSDVKHQIKKLAHVIIKKHNQNSIITIFPIISFSIIKLFQDKHLPGCDKVSYKKLYDSVLLYYQLLEHFKINMVLENDSLDLEIRYQLSLHKNLFSHISIETLRNEVFEISLSDISFDKEVQVKKIIPDNGVVYIILQNYANQFLHHFIDMAIIGIILMGIGNNGMEYEEIYGYYRRMKDILRYEFVYTFGEERDDFERSILRMRRGEIISLYDNNIMIENAEKLKMITNLFEPFVDGYIFVTSIIKQLCGQFLNESELLKECQIQIGKEIIFNNYKFIQNINTDFVKNVISTLKHQHILIKYTSGKKGLLYVKDREINEIIEFLTKISPINTCDGYKNKFTTTNIEFNDFIPSKI
uniref:PlsC domain-containing protein n=1 Tax=Strongyloides papillosus TaxID=174720 RepID=A0A0N5C9Y8_STREA